MSIVPRHGRLAAIIVLVMAAGASAPVPAVRLVADRRSVQVAAARVPSGPCRGRTRTITSPFGSYSRFGDALSIRRRTLLVGAPGAHDFAGAVRVLSGLSAYVRPLPLAPRGLTGYSLG